MVVVEIKGKQLYLDGYLKHALDQLKAHVRKDFDILLVVDGSEGSGKSVFAQGIAYYLSDGNFTIDDVVFSTDEYIKRVRDKQEGDKYTPVILDEAFRGVSSRAALTKENKKMLEVFMESRYKNLFHIMVLPSFFELDKYPAVHRSKLLFHLYTAKGERGRFSCYNYHKKKKIYLVGKKTYDYRRAKPNFYGRYALFYPFTKEAYESKKDRAFNVRHGELEDDIMHDNDHLDYLKKLTKRDLTKLSLQGRMFKLLMSSQNITQAELSAQIQVPRTTISELMKINDKMEKAEDKKFNKVYGIEDKY